MNAEIAQGLMETLMRLAEKRIVSTSNGFGPTEAMVVVGHAYSISQEARLGLPEMMHVIEYLDEIGEVRHIEAHRVEGWHGSGLALVLPNGNGNGVHEPEPEV